MADTPRQCFLACQDAWLRPGALHEADSGGRAHAEPEHPYRTCYQRDRDRIIHCAAFRRLDSKTQVFVPHEQDHYRTRMTHTLEVAQVARTLARALRANEDAAEAVALAHDLGHSPFGHAGEAALESRMAEHGHFEHNRQSLRVVDYLEHPYPDFRGLNLTAAVRCCLAKHRTLYDNPENSEFAQWAQGPLEGQLVDLADEIAFTSTDLADALSAGWITLDDLAGLALWRRGWELAQGMMPHARDIHKRIRACAMVLSMMVDDCLAATTAALEKLAPTHPADIQHAPDRVAGFGPTLAPAVREMQKFMLQRVYLHPICRENETQTRKMLSGLFAAYLAQPTLLPPRYQERIDRDGLHRVICDYIAGMTDRYCRKQYETVVSPVG